MNISWKWFARINARTILAWSVIAFVLVTAWWGWKSMAPLKIDPVANIEGRDDLARRGMEMLPFVTAQLNLDWDNFVGNPFSYYRRPVTIRAPKPRGVVTAVRQPTGPNDSNVKPRPPQIISLLYKGLITRTDGVTIALIEDRTSARTHACPVGDDIEGYRLSGIEQDKIMMSLPSGEMVPLMLGETNVFKESMGGN